jgi:hypothetical protein
MINEEKIWLNYTHNQIIYNNNNNNNNNNNKLYI